MREEFFDEITNRIEEAYINLFLISIDRKVDLESVVQESSEKTDEYCNLKEGFTPKGMEGVVFLSCVAEGIGMSLFDIIYMSEIRKKQIIYDLLNSIDISEIRRIDFEGHVDGFTADFTYLYLLDNETYIHLHFSKSPMEGAIIHMQDGSVTNYKPGILDGLENQYLSISDDYMIYSIEASITQRGIKVGVDSDYMYDSAVIWLEEGEEYGRTADFVESVIDMMKEKDDDSAAEDKNEEALSADLNDSPLIIGHKKPEMDKGKEGKKVLDELVVCITNETKSVSLLDKFEGFGEDEVLYRRMVMQNTAYFFTLGLKNEAGINLVIERSNSGNYVGDITFTEFKQDKDEDLVKFLKKEINDQVVEKYLDKDEFYRFSKPFRLRAQNSSNRTGYGWEWDWTGGYGEYTEGTLYGETTDYVFSGAYITSYLNIYDPDKRKPFSSYLEKTKTQKSKPNVNRPGKEKAIRIITYQGKLSQVTDKSLEQRFVLAKAKNGTTKRLPVSYDDGAGIIYIVKSTYEKYRDQIDGNMSITK